MLARASLAFDEVHEKGKKGWATEAQERGKVSKFFAINSLYALWYEDRTK